MQAACHMGIIRVRKLVHFVFASSALLLSGCESAGDLQQACENPLAKADIIGQLTQLSPPVMKRIQADMVKNYTHAEITDVSTHQLWAIVEYHARRDFDRLFHMTGVDYTGKTKDGAIGCAMRFDEQLKDDLPTTRPEVDTQTKTVLATENFDAFAKIPFVQVHKGDKLSGEIAFHIDKATGRAQLDSLEDSSFAVWAHPFFIGMVRTIQETLMQERDKADPMNASAVDEAPAI
jgi:hypothetical protein